jgi:hypothetical protein
MPPEYWRDRFAVLVHSLVEARELLPECRPTLARVSKGTEELHLDSPVGLFDAYLDSAHEAALAVAELAVVVAYRALGLRVPRACLYDYQGDPKKGLLFTEELLLPTAADVAAQRGSLVEHLKGLITNELFRPLGARIRLETILATDVLFRAETTLPRAASASADPARCPIPEPTEGQTVGPPITEAPQSAVDAQAHDGERLLSTPAIDQEALAIALLFKRPDLSLPGIASEVGVGRQTLYKWPSFLEAAKAAGKYKPKGQCRDALPRGFKPADGTVEAWHDTEDE